MIIHRIRSSQCCLWAYVWMKKKRESIPLELFRLKRGDVKEFREEYVPLCIYALGKYPRYSCRLDQEGSKRDAVISFRGKVVEEIQIVQGNMGRQSAYDEENLLIKGSTRIFSAKKRQGGEIVELDSGVYSPLGKLEELLTAVKASAAAKFQKGYDPAYSLLINCDIPTTAFIRHDVRGKLRELARGLAAEGRFRRIILVNGEKCFCAEA